MRRPPDPQRVEIEFGEQTFPAEATMAFAANHTEDIGPARHVVAEAGRRGTWTVVFTPLEPLPAGARVAFRKHENEFRFAWRHQDYWPDARDYVTVQTGDGGPLQFECDTAIKSKIPAAVDLPGGMAAGESIVIRMGDQREGGAGSYVSPTPYDSAHLVGGVLLPGDEAWRKGTEATVSVEVVPCPPAERYLVYAPSTPAADEDVTVVAVPVEINNNVVEVDQAPVVEIDGNECPVREGGQGAWHATVPVGEDGPSRVTVRDEANGIEEQSNPMRREAGDYNVYWGEFHWHGYDASELNALNETTRPDRLFGYARDVTGLDFTSPGSHVFRHDADAVHEWWEMYRQAAKEYDEEGRFVTFLGCEWRDRPEDGGDRNLIWNDLDVPVPDPTWRIDEVYEQLAKQPAMVIPHVGGAPAFARNHDERVEPLCEMVSGHGQFEWFVQDYLQKGYHVGLIGGSDGHRGTPGHPRLVMMGGGRFYRTLRLRDSGGGGGPLLAVLADGLDRDSLWEAFYARRTYASTGARALVDFRVNGQPMGSRIEASDCVELAIEVHGTAPIERVDLIRGEHRLHRWESDQRQFEVTVTDCPPDGETWYYARIVQADGELLWTSPVWVEAEGLAMDNDLPAWNEPEQIDLDAIGENPACEHREDLMEFLRTEEKVEAFSRITPLKIVQSQRGPYAVFLGYMCDHPIRLHWFYEFELPRLRVEAGWVEYGREIIRNQEWADPLFENF